MATHNQIERQLKRIGVWGDWMCYEHDLICMTSEYYDLRLYHQGFTILVEDDPQQKISQLLKLLRGFPSYPMWKNTESQSNMAWQIWGEIKKLGEESPEF